MSVRYAAIPLVQDNFRFRETIKATLTLIILVTFTFFLISLL